MAAMSDADKTYVTDMTAVHVTADKVARTYLAANPHDRNAILSDMAHQSIADHAAETAKMAAMMSGKPMPPHAGGTKPMPSKSM